MATYRVIETIHSRRSIDGPAEIRLYKGSSKAEAIAAIASAIAQHDSYWYKLLSIRMEVEE